MRAAALRAGKIVVTDIAIPEVGPTQIRVKPLATGICGSDLSALAHTSEFLQASTDTGMSMYMFDPDKDLVMGHEFSAQVIETGSAISDLVPGDVIVAMPYVIDETGTSRTIGYSTEFPGGLAEQVVLEGYGHLVVPKGISPEVAALTEPLTTGTAAVSRSAIARTDRALVTGCGTVGLGAIAALAERGCHPIIASDPSPARRAVALAFGADEAVDPALINPLDQWHDAAGVDQQLVVFEASGARGLINQLMYSVPPFSRIIIVGSGMVDETIRPVVGIYKNLSLEFFGGPARGQDYRTELNKTLERLASGSINGQRLITGRTGIHGAAEAFRLLRPTNPQDAQHIKILINPQSEGNMIESVPQVSLDTISGDDRVLRSHE